MAVPEGRMVPWITFTQDMPRRFKKMFGYEFNTALVSLFYNTGAISAKHRCNYWECATDMYVNAFYKPIYEFCDRYNLRTTGHVNSEGSFPSHIKNQGDFFKVFEYMHYGGVDQLTEDVRPDGIEELWNLDKNPYSGMANEMVTASKLASSAAHLLGKPRVLVESYGTSAWDITMASTKRVTDFLIATGCDLFVPHSFNISEDSYRKGDHPAAFNYQPYYTHWKRVADHCARLCATLNAHSGVLVADVLCLYPAKSFYAEMKPSTSEMAEMVGTYFTHNSDCLFRQQLDFEYASEEMIVAARIDGDRISIKDGTFKVLLLGATTCVTLRFARFVKDFFDAGGKILATYSLPCKDASAGESEEIARIFKDIFNVDPANVATRVKALAIHDFAVHENKNGAGGRAVFIEGPEKPPFSGGYYPLFESACKSLLPLAQRDLLLAKDDAAKHPAYIMTVHKAFGDKDLFFFANTSRTAAYDRVACTLRLRAGKVDLWDTETGEITPFNSWGIKDGKTVLDLSFAPYTSYLLCVTRPATPCIRDIPGKAPLPPVSSVIALDGEWETKLNMPNGAMLYLDWHSSYKVEAGRAWGYHSTRTFTHKFVAHDVRDIAPVKLVIEGLVGDYGWCKTTTDPLVGGDRAHFKVPGSVQVLVNGTKIPITFDFEFKYLDAYWIVLDITSHVKDGENEVQFACTTRTPETFHVVTDPWRLVGYFEVDEKDGVPELRKPRASVKLSDITGQGFPRYHGGFSYIKRVDVPAGTKKAVLKVAGTTDCVEVKVNGKLVDVAWHAWDVDITRSLNAGTTNTIELVHYGTAQNMLQTNIKPHGLTGTVSLEIFT